MTEIRSEQIKNGQVKKEDLCINEPNNSVITQLIPNSEVIGLSYTGADVGTGVVSININGYSGTIEIPDKDGNIHTFVFLNGVLQEYYLSY